MARRLRIRVDHHRCVGSTMCVLTAPAVFALDAGGQSTVIDPAGASEERILDAVEQCPMSAISVEDARTGEPVTPGPDTAID